MKIYLTVNQQFCLKHGIDINLGILYGYFRDLQSWADYQTINGEVWYFCSRNKAAEDLKLLTDKPDTIYRWIKKLAASGLIKWQKLGQRDYINIVKEYSSTWSIRKTDHHPNQTDQNPGKLGSSSESNADGGPTNRKLESNSELNSELEDKKSAQKFKVPSIIQIKEEFQKKGGSVELAERFFNYYESNGWKVGKNKMKKWKSAVAGWMTREGNSNGDRISNEDYGKAGNNEW